MPHSIRLAFAEEIFQTELSRVHPKFLSENIGVAIDSERRRHRAGAAIITARYRVGVNLQKLDIGVIDAILAAGIVPGSERRIGLERAITAARMGPAHRARHDTSVA